MSDARTNESRDENAGSLDGKSFGNGEEFAACLKVCGYHAFLRVHLLRHFVGCFKTFALRVRVIYDHKNAARDMRSEYVMRGGSGPTWLRVTLVGQRIWFHECWSRKKIKLGKFLSGKKFKQ